MKFRDYLPFLGAFLAIAAVSYLGIVASGHPWEYQTCTVTGEYTNPLQSAKGQQNRFVETTCGDFGFNRWTRGSDLPDQLEVGKTYEFGIRGFEILWSVPSIITAEEVL